MNTQTQSRSLWTRVISLVAIVFGLMTIKEGGMVLSGSPAASAAAGNYVPFVLWFNFMAGFAYVIAGAGLWLKRRWAAGLAVVIAVTTLLIFAAFGIHVYFGGLYEQRTLVAMSVRSLVWVMIAFIAWRTAGTNVPVKETK